MAPLNDRLDPLDPHNRAAIRKEAEADTRGAELLKRHQEEIARRQRHTRLETEKQQIESALRQNDSYLASHKQELVRLEQGLREGVINKKTKTGLSLRGLAAKARELLRLEKELGQLETKEKEYERELTKVKKQEQDDEQKIAALQAETDREKRNTGFSESSIGHEEAVSKRREGELKRQVAEEEKKSGELKLKLTAIEKELAATH